MTRGAAAGEASAAPRLPACSAAPPTASLTRDQQIGAAKLDLLSGSVGRASGGRRPRLVPLPPAAGALAAGGVSPRACGAAEGCHLRAWNLHAHCKATDRDQPVGRLVGTPGVVQQQTQGVMWAMLGAGRSPGWALAPKRSRAGHVGEGVQAGDRGTPQILARSAIKPLAPAGLGRARLRSHSATGPCAPLVACPAPESPAAHVCGDAELASGLIRQPAKPAAYPPVGSSKPMASPPGLDPSRAVNAPAFVPVAPPGLAPTVAAAVAAKPFVPGSSGGGAAPAVAAKPFVPGGGGGGGSSAGLAKSASSSSLTSGAVHAPIFVPGAGVLGPACSERGCCAMVALAAA